MGDTYVLTRDGLAELGSYLVSTRNWIEAASSCLVVQP